MTLRCAAAAILALFAAAARAEKPPEEANAGPMERAELELGRLQGEIDPLAARLESLSGDFLEKNGFEAYKAERFKTLSELEERLKRFVSLRQDYLKVRQPPTLMALAVSVGLQVRRGEKDPAALATAFAPSHAGRDFGEETHEFMKRIDRALTRDVGKFAELQRIEYAQRRWRRLLAASLVLLALLSPFAYRLCRRLFPGREISTAPLRQGEVLQGHYRVERELGAGPMGTTYEALDLGLDRRVALKRLSEECSRQQGTLDACMAAARAQAVPGAAKVLAFFEEGGRFYLVRELAGDLDAFIRETPKR